MFRNNLNTKDNNDINNRESSFIVMDAITEGVITRYFHLLNLWSITTEETTVIARRLGIPDAKIETWANDRKPKTIKFAFGTVRKA